MNKQRQRIMAVIGEILKSGAVENVNIVEIYRKVLRNSGDWAHAREGLWNTWTAEVTRIEVSRESTFSASNIEAGVLLNMLIEMNPMKATTVEMIRDDIQLRGVEIGIARVLEALFQFHTQHGEEYQNAFDTLASQRLRFTLFDLKLETWKNLREGGI